MMKFWSKRTGKNELMKTLMGLIKMEENDNDETDIEGERLTSR